VVPAGAGASWSVCVCTGCVVPVGAGASPSEFGSCPSREMGNRYQSQMVRPATGWLIDLDKGVETIWEMIKCCSKFSNLLVLIILGSVSKRGPKSILYNKPLY